MAFDVQEPGAGSDICVWIEIYYPHKVRGDKLPYIPLRGQMMSKATGRRIAQGKGFRALERYFGALVSEPLTAFFIKPTINSLWSL